MDLETLFTSRTGFGVESATFLQRVICRATDGAPLDDLLARGSDTDRAAAARVFGCAPAAVSTAGPPLEVVDLEPVRCGKSLRYAALAVARSQTIDVSIVKPGEEPPRISLLSTATDTAGTLRGHLNVIHERPALRSLLVGETADSITLQHPSGLPIEIKTIAAQRGGYSLAARWSGSVIFDEAPGWHSTDKIVSLEESREQTLGRLLTGAQAIYGGSPWQPAGFCFDAWRGSFGKPTADMLVIQAGPAWELNPVYWTPERVERVKRTSPRTYQMHLLAQFGSAQNAAFDYDDVIAARRALGNIPDFYRPGRGVLAIDPSSLAGDAWAWTALSWMYPPADPVPVWLTSTDPVTGQTIEHINSPARDKSGQIIYRDDHDPRPKLYAVECGAWEGADLRRVSVDDIVSSLARWCHSHGITSVVSDQRESASLESLFRRHRLNFKAYAWTNESKDAAVTTLRRLFKEGRLWLCPNDRLQSELLSYGYRLGANGKFFYAGRFGHDDRAATLITFAHAINDGFGEYPNVRFETSR